MINESSFLDIIRKYDFIGTALNFGLFSFVLRRIWISFTHNFISRAELEEKINEFQCKIEEHIGEKLDSHKELFSKESQLIRESLAELKKDIRQMQLSVTNIAGHTRHISNQDL